MLRPNKKCSFKEHFLLVEALCNQAQMITRM